jgi:hypothetical protein
MDEKREQLVTTLTKDREVAASSPSPFYARLLEHMRDDVRAGGPTWTLLEPYAAEPPTEWYAFRALGGVHYEVLAGERPELAHRYPSAGGDGDADAAWPEVREAFADRDPAVLAELLHPLQTNETSRCGALVGGFCRVARDTGLPVRVLELGASAGLNLHFDRYRYEAGGVALGPADSAVRFVDYWEGGTPDLGAPLEIAVRAGCDLDPIDPTTDHGAITLQSFLWPDERDRFGMLRAALDIARAYPVTVDRESADTWLADALAAPVEGVATVVFHSIFWVYLPEAAQRAIRATIETAAARASVAAPLAWLAYEGTDQQQGRIDLRLRTWPGGEERLLGSGAHHWHPVRWLDGHA